MSKETQKKIKVYLIYGMTIPMVLVTTGIIIQALMEITMA
jgi:hypothetical protein